MILETDSTQNHSVLWKMAKKWPDTEESLKEGQGVVEETTLTWNWKVDLEPEKI